MSEITATECHSRVGKILGESIYHALALKEVLQEERAALENKDTTSLKSASVKKQMCINKLEALEAKRIEVFSTCGFGSDPDDMEALAAWCDDDSLLVRSWEQLIDIVKACHESNSTNGAIIHVRREQIRSALSLLRNGTEQETTYGPRGQDTRYLGARSIAEV